MAITRAELQVTWSSANSLSVSAGLTGTSDIMTMDATCVAAAITLKADNAGTPVSGDTVDFFLLASAGDPDGAATDEYTSADSTHALFLGRIDTNTTDPGLITVEIPAVPQKIKIYAENNAASSVTISATIEEQRAA